MTSKKRVPVVAVLNMKGGVGKTTISANLTHTLYARNQISALLLDLDPQFNLTQALITEAEHEALLQKEKTILSAMEQPKRSQLFDIALADTPVPIPADINHSLRHEQVSGKDIRLDLVAGDFALVKYSFISENFKLTAVQNRFLQFVEAATNVYDLVCIDCNPSSSFITFCAIHACTHLLVPVRPDRFSLRGLDLLVRLLDEIPTKYPKPQLLIVVNGVSGSQGPLGIEAELRAHKDFGKRTLAKTLRETAFLRASPNNTGFAVEKGGPYITQFKSDLDDLAKEVAPLIGL